MDENKQQIPTMAGWITFQVFANGITLFENEHRPQIPEVASFPILL